MNPLVLTPSAKRDVSDIWEYIAGDSIEAADRVLNALDSALAKLAAARRPPKKRKIPALALDGPRRFNFIFKLTTSTASIA